MKFVFFGSSEFSVAILERLISEFHEPLLVITQPDKPVGRKGIITSPPIKEVCTSHNIPLLQPEKVKDTYNELAKLNADVFITAAYGQIIPKRILDIPPLGSVNVHASLLPKYRGASPIQAAILNNESETGITLMKMDEKMDHGEIIYTSKVIITPTDTAESLHAKLANCGAEVIGKALPFYKKGILKPKEQDHTKATFCSIIKKEQAKINWSETSCLQVNNMVRAYYPWPIAWTKISNDKRLKIYSAEMTNIKSSTPGLIEIINNNLFISCSDNKLKIQTLQLEGKNKLSTSEFIKGNQSLHNTICK